MELRNPGSPNGPDFLPLVPSHSGRWRFDGDSPGNKVPVKDALRRTYRPSNPSSTNDSRELGYFWQAMTIMCCRNEGHTKAALILPLPGTHGGMVIARREHGPSVSWTPIRRPSRSARMSEHLIRLRKGWELEDLDSPDHRPQRVSLPLEAGWAGARRLRLTRRFGCPPLNPGSESLWLRLESVLGLASLRLNDLDLTPGPVSRA